jgi:alpha-galactosidase
MKSVNSIAWVFLFLLAALYHPIFAISPTPDELAMAQAWAKEYLYSLNTAKLPFSFVYDGKPSTDFLSTWKMVSQKKELDPNRRRCTTVYNHPDDPLEIRCEVIEYRDFPTVEWTLYFKNTGSTDTPILENIQSLNIAMDRAGTDEYLLHYFNGGGGAPSDYQPNQAILSPGAEQKFSARNGRPTDRHMSYFNLEWSGQGMLIAVGWPGQWAASFSRDQASGLQIHAGQEQIHCKLLPGEEIRSPLTVIQFWKGGDWIRSQNIWRHWMLAHNLPRVAGKLPAPQFAGSIAGYGWVMFNSREENHLMFLEKYRQEKIPLDTWWMDLGWFVLPPLAQRACGISENCEHPLEEVGTWTVESHRFPNGLKPISDFCHAHNMKTILWFEPEHIWIGTWQAEKKPEWLLWPPKTPGIEKEINQGVPMEGRMVLNMGHPEALQWINDRTCQVLQEQGVDTYRLDFNIEPLIFWQTNDSQDRQGITENHYVKGILNHFDTILHCKPDMMIDNCASGGRRNDLETMRRSVPLWRSDYAGEPVGMQGMTYGIAFWLPYFGHEGGHLNPYQFRSNMYPSIVMGQDVRNPDLNFEYLRKMIAQWRKIAPCYMGDYYPLTPHSLEKNVWIAWQFDQPQTGEGFVQAFRRDQCNEETSQLKLGGLEPQAQYTLQNFDLEETQIATGQELLEKGLLIRIPDAPGAAVIAYTKKTQ